METGRIRGIKAGDYADFFLRGREAGTLAAYSGAFKLVWGHAASIGCSVFQWGEGEMAGLVVKLATEGRGENMLKKCSAVVSLLCEAAGLEAPTHGSALKSVRKAAVKAMNLGKVRRKPRRGTGASDVAMMIKEIYLKQGRRAPAVRRRFLAMQCLLFFGVKRFSDINRIRVSDINFREDGGLEICMRRSKTDSIARGSVFKISGEKKGGVAVSDIIMWHLKALQIPPHGYVFCQVDKFGNPKFGECIKYAEARLDLIREQERLGIEGLTLHSGRIGGATAAAAAGVDRAVIKKQGGWLSDAVDLYIRAEGQDMKVSEALVGQLDI